MKRRSLMLVLMLVMALMLFACNGRPVRGEFVIPEGGFDTTQEVTITFHHTMGANLREKLDLALEDFKEIYPNITVVHEQIFLLVSLNYLKFCLHLMYNYELFQIMISYLEYL